MKLCNDDKFPLPLPEPLPKGEGTGRGERVRERGSSLKCVIYTLGCKANQADSDLLSEKLCQAGFNIVSHKEEADLCIINTCTVTGKAAYQSRQAIRKFFKKNPGSKIVVMGCDTEVEADVLKSIDGVSLVVNNDEKDNLAEILLENYLTNSNDHQPTTIDYKRSRPFIKIQDGCDNFCSYCIVPHVRGGLKSERPEDIIKRVDDCHRKGFYEVVLTGIHIGKYGYDLLKAGDSSPLAQNDIYNLASLLDDILKSTDIGRVRLSSIEPDELSDELIGLIARSDGRVCPHLHIPLQSGCDATLRRMGRKYTTRQYAERIEKVRAAIPNISIGADVITGFPAETDEESETTRMFIENLPITYLHVFSYSDRKGTPASKMKSKVPEAVKRERTASLRKISTAKRGSYLRDNLGRKVIVIFDKNKKDGYWKGVSENYINVLVREKEGDRNCCSVKLVELKGESAVAEIARHCEDPELVEGDVAI